MSLKGLCEAVSRIVHSLQTKRQPRFEGRRSNRRPEIEHCSSFGAWANPVDSGRCQELQRIFFNMPTQT